MSAEKPAKAPASVVTSTADTGAKCWTEEELANAKPQPWLENAPPSEQATEEEASGTVSGGPPEDVANAGDRSQPKPTECPEPIEKGN
ncbi:MAG: hypothetical protein ACRBM6_15800 [Geminicoccales bacterium]